MKCSELCLTKRDAPKPRTNVNYLKIALVTVVRSCGMTFQSSCDKGKYAEQASFKWAAVTSSLNIFHGTHRKQVFLVFLNTKSIPL